MKKKLSVLIVDDDPNIGDTLTDVLNAKGYDAGFVTSGREALSIIKKKNIDAILLDIRMPGMNGVETLKRIKGQSPLTSVVMITAYAEDELVNHARANGALHILSKPLDIDKIIGFLKKQEILKTIFIVDDDKAFCDSLKDAIEIHSYDVAVVNNAQEAIKTFSKRKYGIILLDMKLDGETGLDVAEAIKKQGYKCAIIMMSAYKKEFQPLLDKAGQINNFIEKPFEIQDILKLLNEISRKRLKEVLAA
ncbi:MAG: response regulator [Planctomycetota bacterium]